MNLPGFTGEASLYRTRNLYRVSATISNNLPYRESIVPEYFPGPGTQAACNNCLEGCAMALAECSSAAMSFLAGCVFPPACPVAAAIAGGALAACSTESLLCTARCEVLRCCPKVCGFPNPFEPGEGCCDSGENCVDESDPNARHGCCPSNQSVCGGKCCPTGLPCCGNECGCTGGTLCMDGVCTFPPFGSGGPPPPPPLTKHDFLCLITGRDPCFGDCCPPGTECCGPGSCLWTCVK
jgi:hypothetical protein